MKRFKQTSSVFNVFENGPMSVFYSLCVYGTLKSCFSSFSAFSKVQDEPSAHISRASIILIL